MIKFITSIEKIFLFSVEMTLALFFLVYKHDPENKRLCGIDYELKINTTQIEASIGVVFKDIAPFTIIKIGEINDGYFDTKYLHLLIDTEKNELEVIVNEHIITNEDLMKDERNFTGSINFN